MLRACAYCLAPFDTAALERWLHYYNWHRGLRAVGGAPPINILVSRETVRNHI